MASAHIPSLLLNIWPDLVPELNKSWETPETLISRISSRLSESWTSSKFLHSPLALDITIIGAPDQYILCLNDEEQVAFCSQGQLSSHPFISELRDDFSISFAEYVLDPTGICLITPLTLSLRKRLSLPSVLLVSLFHPEMYPTSRLTLGIAYLASYLRLHHLAHVNIIDCQFGSTIDDIMSQLRSRPPAILGISVNFGQFDLMETLLKRVYDSVEDPPLVVLGNILPAMCYREILKAYPQVVICRKEGELSLAALARYGQDRMHWNQVPGIYYMDVEHEKIVSTPSRYLPMEHLPPAALDTVQNLFEHDGVITAEFSRGCQYNQCSFCPRTHKGSIWRTVPVDSMVQQWNLFAHIFQHFGRPRHVFLADEDFIGKEEKDGATLQRLGTFLDRVQHLDISFDASCRADQIFREGRDSVWHIARGQLFKRCKNGGLKRLFLGVESGAASQLIRYNKGSSVEEMVSAIRYLSLLGIKLRFGFIFFDPLMSAQDVIDNIEFLGRTDIILPKKTESVEAIYNFVAVNHKQILQHEHGTAVYEDVSYMISQLEVLSKSRYLFELEQQSPILIDRKLDVSFARYHSNYTVPEIGMICFACQSWVNYCFPVVYALKGLQKVSHGDEKRLLQRTITGHRYLSYALIRSLAYVFALVDEATMQRWESQHPGINNSTDLHRTAQYLYQAGNPNKAILVVLDRYIEQVHDLIDQVTANIHVLAPTKRSLWMNACEQWNSTTLSETPIRRIA